MYYRGLIKFFPLHRRILYANLMQSFVYVYLYVYEYVYVYATFPMCNLLYMCMCMFSFFKRLYDTIIFIIICIYLI